MHNMRVILLSTLVLASLASIAQTNGIYSLSKCKVGINEQYLKGYWTDTKAVFSSPAHWKKKDWLKASAFTAATVGLYLFVDQDLNDWTQEHKNTSSQNISHAFEIFGNGRYPVFTTAALYGIGAIIKRNKPKRVSMLILESYLITGVTAQVFKFLSSRERPWSDKPHDVWGGPTLKDPKASFFSGHASTVWAFATVFAMEYKDKKWVPPLAYSIATLSSLSRIHDKAHWASDVFVGSLVGYFMTKKIVETSNDEKRFECYAGLNSLRLTFNF